MSILLTVPTYGGITASHMKGVYFTGRKFKDLGIELALLTLENESMICRARSNMANFFLHKTNLEYLMFVDSDIGFIPEDIIKLMELKVQFAAGAVPLKGIPTKYNFGVKLEDDKVAWNDEHSAFKVDHVGTAFMLIHRSVFFEIANAHPELRFKPSSHVEDFTPEELNNSFYYFMDFIDKQTGSHYSEDYSFCKRWLALGGDIWLHKDIALTHTGSHVFEAQEHEKIINVVK